MSSPVPKIIIKDNKHFIKIDYGRYYYESEIYKNIFTSEIIDPIDLVQKAIENFSTPTYKISYSFETMFENKKVLEIVINIKNEIIKESKQFSIPMIYYVKNENDIINERFYQLEDIIKELKNENQTLKNEMKSILKNLNKKETEINTDSELYDTSDSSESVHVPVKQTLISKRKQRNVI